MIRPINGRVTSAISGFSPPGLFRVSGLGRAKELILSYQCKEPILFTVYPKFSKLTKAPEQDPATTKEYIANHDIYNHIEAQKQRPHCDEPYSE